jgi:WD40 repeat protein
MIDPDLMASSCDLEVVKLWKIREINNIFQFECVRVLKDHHEGVAVRSVIRYDSERIISGGSDDKIIIWE